MENFYYKYKGERIHIRRAVDEIKEFLSEYEIFDSYLEIEFGKAKLLDDGTWEGCVWFGPQEFPIRVENVRDLARLSHSYLLDFLKD